jgi:hypothetical protein
MTNRSLSVVRRDLQAYADRGVFRGFSETKGGRGKQSFEFLWLTPRRMGLSVDTEKGALTFKNLLPQVPVKSALYAELKEFIKQRHDLGLPAHRRVDRKQAEVICCNRRGMVSLTLKVKNNRYAYGVNKLVNLVHELFLHLRATHPDYLAENFDVSQE